MSKKKNNVMKYVIELIVLLIIGVVAYYGISKINPAVTRNNQKTVTVTFEAQDAQEQLLNKIAVGDPISDNVKNASLGTIKSLSEPRPATKVIADYENEKFIQAPVEGLYTMDIVSEFQADVSDTAIMAGDTELKIGYTIPLINEDYLVTCTVTDIKIAV